MRVALSNSTEAKKNSADFSVGVDERQILDMIKLNPNITAGEIARDIGISERKVRYILAELKDRGMIKRSGSNKSGHWDIIR